MPICAVAGCPNGTDIVVVGCWCCRLDFCLNHYRDPTHKCLMLPAEEMQTLAAKCRVEEFRNIIARIRQSVNLKGMAESLRPSRTCTIHYPEAYGDPDIFAGGFHIHLLIEFDDGVKWLARIRQTSSHLMSNEEGIIVTESAITTQHVMHKAGLKVADAWPFTGFSDGLIICLMEFVPGSSLTDDRILDISDSKIRRTIRDYARFCVSITKLQFSQIGSLTRSPNGKLYVGPLVKGRAASSKAALFLGPFESQAHRYLSAIDEKLQNWSAAAGPCGQSPIVTYLIQREVREMIAQDEEMNQAATCTYIRHEELAPHNFMVDDEGSITAVIDWDWAHVTTKEEAFMAPFAFWDDEGRCSVQTNSLSQAEEMLAGTYDELGRSDLGDCVRGGKKYQRLLSPNLRYESFKALVPFFPKAAPLHGNEDTFRREVEKKYEGDETLRDLIQKEKGPGGVVCAPGSSA